MISYSKNRCYVIAEAGVNHNGNLELAHKLVDVAADSGVDALKFQTFRTEKLVTQTAPRARYQSNNTGSDASQFSMLKALELDTAAHYGLRDHCKEKGIDFLSTPFDLESLDFLVNQLGINRIKIGSGDLTNALLLLNAARSQRPIILSTGMSFLGEVERALGIIAYGYINQTPSILPNRNAFENAYASDVGQKALMEKVVLLHCTTEYPTPLEQVNLRVMETLKQTFSITSGLSDHTPGITAAISAVARGAQVIEKHFTLDKTLPGPDHAASLNPLELKQLVTSIRQVEQLLGQPVKYPVQSEQGNRKIARRGLVAACAIKKGEVFSQTNLEVKRGGEISGFDYWDWLGKVSTRDYEADEVIQA